MNCTPLALNSKYILPLAMIYAALMIAASTVAFKFVNLFGFVESGATIIFPLTYVIGDIICEVYGWNISMRIIWLGLLCESLFALLITLIIHMPNYGIGPTNALFIESIGSIWLFVIAGVAANAIAFFVNISIISRTKILTNGRIFWLRSLFSTAISELIIVSFTGIIAFSSVLAGGHVFHIIIDAYILEIAYALIFVFPAQLLVTILKKSEAIDAYDTGIKYNPFKLT